MVHKSAQKYKYQEKLNFYCFCFLKLSLICFVLTLRAICWYLFYIFFICIFFYCSPCDRNLRDVELISCRLRRVEPLCRLPGSALQQLAMCGFYEDLEKGVTRKWNLSINYVHNILNECCSLFFNNNFFCFRYFSSPLVFRAGEQGRFWYAVLGGSLEVRYHAHSDADGKVSALTHQYNREIYIHICLCQLLSSTMAWLSCHVKTMHGLNNIIDGDYIARIAKGKEGA